MLTVTCVLRSGGDYDWSYVEKLRKGLDTHLTIPHNFICYTDMLPWDGFNQEFARDDVFFYIRKLQKSFTGSWAKLETLGSTGETLYIDLDTIILKNIDGIIAFNRNWIGSDNQSFSMLSAFKEGEMWASGIMYWNGDFNWVQEQATVEVIKQYGKWDQRYIKQTLLHNDITIRNIWGNEIKSYKWDCMDDGIPDDAKIICFHGKPRPKDTNLWEIEY
jgi:hypothetical protein